PPFPTRRSSDLLASVAGSRGSTPVSAPSAIAASPTVRPMTPTVSCVAEIGITPARLVSPTVGLIATIPLIAAGLTRDPLVSVPSAMAVRLADTATAEPLLDPDGDRSSAYGLRVCPPR